VLKGDLATTPLPNVLEQLADGLATGCLHVIDPNGENGKPSERYAKQPANRNNVGVSWSRDGKTFVYLSTR